AGDDPAVLEGIPGQRESHGGGATNPGVAKSAGVTDSRAPTQKDM
ncbi:RNA polymerase sigma factor, partial [Streptomyces sp. WAC05858]